MATQTAWITGGGSGIGAALAKRLAAEGWRVFISGRDENKLNAVGAATEPVVCDVTSPEQVAAALASMPPIDLAILSAGMYNPAAVRTTSLASFEEHMAINFFGAVHCLQALLSGMQQRGGHIAVVASLAGCCGMPNTSGYGASKAALIHVCESLAVELHDSRVKLQLINPGFVKTPLTAKNQFPMPFLMGPDAAAERIMQGLVSERFEISFPRRLAWTIKTLKLLPYPIVQPLMKRFLV